MHLDLGPIFYWLFFIELYELFAHVEITFLWLSSFA